MKNLLFILCAILLVASCKPQDPETEKQELIASKKKDVSSKKAEVKKLQDEIAVLAEEILELEPRKEKAAALITTETLKKQDFNRFTQVQASVLSDEQVYVSSETGGRLLSVRVKEGQYVKRGQLIATVDLKSLSDQKAELETSMSLVKDVYDRQKRLWDKNIGSEIQYLQAKNNYERLEKSLNRLHKQT